MASASMALSDKGEDEPRRPGEQDFRVTFQALFLREIDFKERRISGYAYVFLQLDRKTSEVFLHADQMQIHSVRIGKTFTDFCVKSPFKQMFRGQKSSDASKKPLRSAYDGLLAEIDPLNSKGEVAVKIPEKLLGKWTKERNVLKIVVEFSLKNPKGGIQFRVPEGYDNDKELDMVSAHMFCAPYHNSARSCFPCIDASWALCSWELVFIVPRHMLAVASGEMITHQMCDEEFKYVQFRLRAPTRASNIAFAVGHFRIYIHRFLPRVTSFCLRGLEEHMRANCHKAAKIIKFFEKFVGLNFPQNMYHQVFVDGVVGNMSNHTGITIFDQSLLHPPEVIEQSFRTPKFLALAAAQQFFGCFLQSFSWKDKWACEGAARFMAGIYVMSRFGNDYYMEWMRSLMHEVIAFEKEHGGLVMDWSRLDAASAIGVAGLQRHLLNSSKPYYHRIESALTCSPRVIEMHAKKAHLVVRILDSEVGPTALRLALASLSRAASDALRRCSILDGPPVFELLERMALTTEKLRAAINSFASKPADSFFDSFVYMPGHARFIVECKYSSAAMTYDVDIKQYAAGHTYPVDEHVYPYVGPVDLHVQEIEGCHKIVVHIDGPHVRTRVPLCSGNQRPRRKLVPLANGKEVRMNLSKVDDEDPTLWLKFDPHYKVIREVELYQPDNFLMALLRFERDAVAQLDAIEDLIHYPSIPARKLLMDMVANESVYISVRCAAANAVVAMTNSQIILWNGESELAKYFRHTFGSGCIVDRVLMYPNNFCDFPAYFLKKAIPLALARLRGPGKLCSPGVIKFLLALVAENDNRGNLYRDDSFRAALIEALAESANVLGGLCPFKEVRDVTKAVAEKIQETLNLSRSHPSYKEVVPIACLSAIFTLQKKGILFPQNDLYRAFAHPGIFLDLRKTALLILVDLLSMNGKESDFLEILDVAIGDEYACIRHTVLERLVEHPPFVVGRYGLFHPTNTSAVCFTIWQEVTSEISGDSMQRNDFVCLWETLYGSSMTYPDVVRFLRVMKNERTSPSLLAMMGEECVSPMDGDTSSDETIASSEDDGDDESLYSYNRESDSEPEGDIVPVRAQRMRWYMGTESDDEGPPPLTYAEVIPKVIVREEGKRRHFILHEHGQPIVCEGERCRIKGRELGIDQHVVCKSTKIGLQQEPHDDSCLICNIDEEFWPASARSKMIPSGAPNAPSFTLVPDKDIRAAWNDTIIKDIRSKGGAGIHAPRGEVGARTRAQTICGTRAGARDGSGARMRPGVGTGGRTQARARGETGGRMQSGTGGRARIGTGFGAQIEARGGRRVRVRTGTRMRALAGVQPGARGGTGVGFRGRIGTTAGTATRVGTPSRLRSIFRGRIPSKTGTGDGRETSSWSDQRRRAGAIQPRRGALIAGVGMSIGGASVGNPEDVGYHVGGSSVLKLRLRKEPSQPATVGVLDGVGKPTLSSPPPRRRRGRPPSRRGVNLAQENTPHPSRMAMPKPVEPTPATSWSVRQCWDGSQSYAFGTRSKFRGRRMSKKEMEEEKFAYLEKDAAMGKLPLPVLNELPRVLGLARDQHGYTVSSGAPGYFTFEPSGWHLNIDGSIMNAGIRGRGRGRAAIKRKAEEEYGLYVPPDKKLKVPFPPWSFNRRKKLKLARVKGPKLSAAELAKRRSQLHAVKKKKRFFEREFEHPRVRTPAAL